MRGPMEYAEYDSDTNYYQKVYEYNFTYLFGIRKMNVHGMIDLDNSKTYLITPDSDLEQSIMHKAVNQELLDHYGIDVKVNKTEFKDQMSKKKIRKIYVYYGRDTYTEKESHFFDEIELLSGNEKAIDYDTLYPILNNTRTIKSDIEMEFMRDICRISSEAHIYMMQNCKPGLFEYQLESLFWVSLKELLCESRS